MSRERELLRRLVEWYDEMPGYGSIGAIASDARALLAEPEKQRWQSDLTVDQHLLCDSNRAGKVTIDPTLLSPPTPRSRAEAEAMVEELKEILEILDSRVRNVCSILDSRRETAVGGGPMRYPPRPGGPR